MPALSCRRPTDGAGLVLQAFEAVLKAEPAEHAVRNALKQVPSPSNVHELTQEGGRLPAWITEEQAADLIRAQELSEKVIAVDEFTPGELAGQQASQRPALAEAS